MKSSKLLTLLSALAFSATASAVTTDAVGFVSVTVPANSDAVLAVPLNRAAEFKGVIQTIAGNTITVAGTPAWGNNIFAPGVTANKTYAVQIASGAKEGMIGRITGNGANTLTITLESGDDTTGIGSVDVPVDPDGVGPLAAQSDQVDIMPYWTPASLFTGAPNGSEIFAFNPTSGSGPTGTNLSPSALMVFDTTSGSWLDQISEESVDNVALKFGVAVGFRNNSGASYALSMVGSVPMNKHRSNLSTLANNTDQDIRIGFSSPIPELLSTLSIPAVSGDQLFAYNNSAAGKNKSPSQILVFDGSDWVDSTSELPVPSFQIMPGFGYVYRKFRTATASSVVWSDLQSYLAP